MNTRRGFLKNVLKSGIGVYILPAALTYSRRWKKVGDLWIVNPAWENAELDVSWYCNDINGKHFMSFPEATRIDSQRPLQIHFRSRSKAESIL